MKREMKDFDFDFDLLSEHPIGTQGHKNTKKETKGRKLFEKWDEKLVEEKTGRWERETGKDWRVEETKVQK